MGKFYAVPHRRLSMRGKREIVKGMFDIKEIVGYEHKHICTISNRGDRLNNILKRGIPLEDAQRIFYEMDE